MLIVVFVFQNNMTSPGTVLYRAWTLLTGFGMSINGKHVFCGDYIYSGHTCMLVFSYLLYNECESCIGQRINFRVKILGKNFFSSVSSIFPLRSPEKGLAGQSPAHLLSGMQCHRRHPRHDITGPLHRGRGHRVCRHYRRLLDLPHHCLFPTTQSTLTLCCQNLF